MAERPTKAMAMSAADWINTHTIWRANNVTADWPSMKDMGWWLITADGEMVDNHTDAILIEWANVLGWKSND